MASFSILRIIRLRNTLSDEIELEKAEAGAKDTYVRWLITRKDGAKKFAMRLFELEHFRTERKNL